jgi:hypothetical protein
MENLATPTSIGSDRIYASSSTMVPKKKKVEWSPENEKILVEWCDIAQCYKWLNRRAHSKYSTLHAYYTIPAIVLSTITGTASFAQQNLPDNMKAYAPAIIGSVNIAIGILATLQQFLKISELNEAHRVASIAWDKFARNIRIEIAKAPDERPDAGIFLKFNRDEYDRLMETSPSIPDEVIAQFTKTFSVENQTDPKKKKQFELLKRPDICDIIISAEENRHHWYKAFEVDENEPTEFEEKFERDLFKLQDELKQKEHKIMQKEAEMEKQAVYEMKKKEMQIIETEHKEKYALDKITAYVKMFTNANGREPIADEIRDHFAEQEDPIFIEKFIVGSALDNV